MINKRDIYHSKFMCCWYDLFKLMRGKIMKLELSEYISMPLDTVINENIRLTLNGEELSKLVSQHYVVSKHCEHLERTSCYALNNSLHVTITELMTGDDKVSGLMSYSVEG